MLTTRSGASTSRKHTKMNDPLPPSGVDIPMPPVKEPSPSREELLQEIERLRGCYFHYYTNYTNLRQRLTQLLKDLPVHGPDPTGKLRGEDS